MTTEPPPIPRSRLRRWRRRLLILGVLALLLAVLVPLSLVFVLRTDLPRRLAVEGLQERTGLRVSVGSLSVGWGGESTAHDVVLRLPSDDAPIVAVPVLHLRHASVPRMLVMRDPVITGVTLERPEINMSENAGGEWTLVRAVELIQAAAPHTPGAVVLPRIVATGGVVNLKRPGRKALSLPLELNAAPDGANAAQVEATLGGTKIKGRVTTTTGEQSLDVNATGLGSVLQLWTTDVPAPVAIDAHWEGRLHDRALTGDIDVRSARAGEHHAKGRLRLGVESGAVAIGGSGIEVMSPAAPGGRADIREFDARIDGPVISCDRISGRLEGTDIQLHGTWRMDSSHADFVTDWSRSALAPLIHHSGHAQISASLPPTGPLSASGTLDVSGGVAWALWNARTTVEAEGTDWEHLTGCISAPSLELSASGESIDLSGLRANLFREGAVIGLASLTLPDAAATDAQGDFNASSNEWRLQLRLAGLSDPRLPGAPIGLSLSASGDAKSAEFSELILSNSQGELSAIGTFDAARQTPLQGRVRIRAQLPPDLQFATTSDRSVEGLVCDADVTGEIQPLLLHAKGDVNIPELRVESGTIGPLVVPIRVLAATDSISFNADPTNMLDGRVGVGGVYWPDQSLVALSVDAHGVPLDRVLELASPGAKLGGKLDSRFVVRIPGLDTARADAQGRWTIRDFGRDAWVVPEGEGAFATDGSRLSLSGVTLRNADAEASGSLELEHGIARIDVAARRWPLNDPEGRIAGTLNGTGKLSLDLGADLATGTVEARADARLRRGTPIGAQVTASIDGRTVRATSLNIDVLGGRVSGAGTLPIDDWTKAAADLRADQIDLAQLGSLFGPRVDMKGTAAGPLTIAPTTDARGTGSLRIGGDLHVTDGSLHRLQLGNVTFVAFAGRDRVMLDQSSLAIAGGAASLSAQLSWREKEPFLEANLLGTDLDVDQLVHQLHQEIGVTPGRLDLRASGSGYLNAPHRAAGEAMAELRNADLQPIPAFALLYSVLRIDILKSEPSGKGRVDFRLDGDALRIVRLRYFNRGTDINGAGRIENIWAGAQSPVQGGLVATLRPLKGLNLPFGRELDGIINGIMPSAASVRISGTPASLDVKVVPLGDVMSFVGGIFGGNGPK